MELGKLCVMHKHTLTLVEVKYFHSNELWHINWLLITLSDRFLDLDLSFKKHSQLNRKTVFTKL